MTRHRTGAVRCTDGLLTGSCAVVARDDTESEERHGEDRVLSKIKGDGTADARSRGLHVNGGGTPRPGASGEVCSDCWRWLVSARAVYAGLRWVTRNDRHD